MLTTGCFAEIIQDSPKHSKEMTNRWNLGGLENEHHIVFGSDKVFFVKMPPVRSLTVADR